MLVIAFLTLACVVVQNDATGQGTPSQLPMEYIKMLRKATADEDYRWPDGPDGYPLVPYRFKENQNPLVNETAVGIGMNHWMEHTCITFNEINYTIEGNQPHLKFYNGYGSCSSKVGRETKYNGQHISINPELCKGLHTIAHEIGHAMGFYHEHARADRDDYIWINWDNIRSGKAEAFEKRLDIDNYGVPYDYSSIMHYKTKSWCRDNNPVIFTKDPMMQNVIERNEGGLSHRDKLLANRMYNCTGKWLTACNISSDPCLNDGYTGKNCTCICPPGTNGSNCEEVIHDYYALLLHPRNERIYTEMDLTIASPIEIGYFVKWIIPPTCQRAILAFTKNNMYHSCSAQVLYIRTDPSESNYTRLCYSTITAGVTNVTSDVGIIITMFNFVKYDPVYDIWKADITFEDITGCSTPVNTTQSTTTQPPSTTPVNPPTTTPVNPPTTTPVNPPTTTSVNPPTTTPVNSPTTTPVNPPTTTPVNPPTTTPVNPPTTTPVYPPTTTPVNPPTTTPVNPPTTTPDNPPTTTPVNPPTTTPVNPPTTTANPPTTTQAPPPNVPFKKKPRMKYLRKGDAITITSPVFPNRHYYEDRLKGGWNLQAKRKAKLEMTCDTFQLHGKDRFMVNRISFKRFIRPSTMISKRLSIMLITQPHYGGPGFTCVVAAK